jgi:hypothetical protein
LSGLILTALALAAQPAAPGPLVLQIDPCVQVDAAAVGRLLGLELSDQPPGGRATQSVTVTCAGGAVQVRAEPWASRQADGVRTLELPAASPDPAVSEGRARVLALAIAELVRRLATAAPPPAPAPAIAAAPAAPAPERPADRWQIGVVSAGEYATGGQKLLGGDLVVAARLGRWVLAELRAGGRAGPDRPLPQGELALSAASASLLAGPQARWARHRVALALLLGAQGLVAQYTTTFPGGGQRARLAAAALVIEPRLAVAVARRVSIAAAAGLGRPVRGILVRDQGAPADSLSGLWLSGSLGAVISF